MDQPTTTRRSLIRTAGLTSLAATVPTVAAAYAGVTQIERHWQDRCAAFRAFEADRDVLDMPERARVYWDQIDAAEIAILNSPDTSARATELRLWVAWSHCDETNRTAVAQGDVPALLRIRDELDWGEKLIFAAILNLRGEG